MNVRNKNLIMLLIVTTLMLTMFSGCKKKSESAVVTEAGKTAVAIEQTTCPVMEGAINKELYTEHEGKKVYFCCPGCQEKFEAAPQEYLSKLPQFSK